MGIRINNGNHGLRAEFEKTVQEAEVRYEMLSGDMARALADGTERETEDKLTWMYAYHALRSLDKTRTRTDGTPGTTIDLSMKTGLRITGS